MNATRVSGPLALVTMFALSGCGEESPLSASGSTSTNVDTPNFQMSYDGDGGTRSGGGGGYSCLLSLQQVSNESPLPQFTLCSNAQSAYMDLDLRVSFLGQVGNPTATLYATGGVEFSSGNTTWPNAGDGDIVTVRLAAGGPTGTWTVTAIGLGCGFAQVTGTAFKFVPLLTNWVNTPGVVTVPAVSSATSTASGNVTNISIATSGPGNSLDLDFQTSAQNNASADLIVVTDPPAAFNGQVKAGVSVEHLTIFDGVFVDHYIDNGPAGTLGLTVGPFSFSYDFDAAGAGFMGQTGLTVGGVPSYGAKHQVMTDGLLFGLTSLARQTLATLTTSGDATNRWTVGGGHTIVPVQAAILCVVEKHAQNDRIEAASANSTVRAFASTPFEIQ